MKNRENTYNFIEKRVLSFIREQNMFAEGEPVILGVSGGADSVCLLVVLHALAKELGIRLHVAHVNHGVRAEAGEDAAYVEQLCAERNIPFYLKNVDMNGLAAEQKCSPEEAGRNARYSFFEELAEQTGARKIAVAHHMGDCSETMLFNLFRGSGLSGLSGIRPVRENVVRPLLCLERKEIEEYLGQQGISYCHDRTNDGDDYTRNRIRHHILSYAEEEIVAGATRNIYEAARQIDQTRDFVEQQVESAWREVLLRQEERIELSVPGMRQLHPVLQKGILRKGVGLLAKGCKDITREHIESLLTLVEQPGSRKIYLPYGLRGERSYEKLLLYIEKEKSGVPKETELDIRKLKVEPLKVPTAEGMLEICVFSYSGNLRDIPQNKYTKWFDYDKIKGNLKIRTRLDGDYFSVKKDDGLGRKKLKDYLMDEKVPRQQRDEILLIAEDSHVLWLMSYRISEYYKVEGCTKNILQIRFMSIDGGTYGETQS